MNYRTITILLSAFLLWHQTSASGNTEINKAEKYLERRQVLYEISDYDSLPYYYRTAEAIFLKYNKHIQVAICLLGMSDYFRMTNRLSRSKEVLDSAEIYIRQHIGVSSESWADALNTKAKLFMRNHQYDQAISQLHESLLLMEELNIVPEKIAGTQDILGSSYVFKGNLQKAQ